MQIESHNGIGHSYSFDQDIIRQEALDILDMKDNIFLGDLIAKDKSDSTCNCTI